MDVKDILKSLLSGNDLNQVDPLKFLVSAPADATGVAIPQLENLVQAVSGKTQTAPAPNSNVQGITQKPDGTVEVKLFDDRPAQGATNQKQTSPSPVPINIPIRDQQAQLPQQLEQAPAPQLPKEEGFNIASPGIANFLGQMAKAIAGRDKTSIGYQLGDVGSQRAQNLIYNQFLRNLLGNPADGSATLSGLSPMAVAGLTPEQQNAALDQFRSFGDAEVDRAFRRAQTAALDTPEGRLEKQKELEAFKASLKKPDEPTRRFITLEEDAKGRPTPGVKNVFAVNPATGKKQLIGRAETEIPGADGDGVSFSALDSSLSRWHDKAVKEAEAAIDRAGFGKLINLGNGETTIEWDDPEKADKIYKEFFNTQVKFFQLQGQLPIPWLGIRPTKKDQEMFAAGASPVDIASAKVQGKSISTVSPNERSKTSPNGLPKIEWLK